MTEHAQVQQQKVVPIVGDGGGLEAGRRLYEEELALALRNHALPLEGLRYDVTPVGIHYLLIHFDVPATDEATWAVQVDGLVSRPASLTIDDLRARPVAAGDGHGRRSLARRAEDARRPVCTRGLFGEDLRVQGEKRRLVLRGSGDDVQDVGRVLPLVQAQLEELAHPVRVVRHPREAVGVERPELAELHVDELASRERVGT